MTYSEPASHGETNANGSVLFEPNFLGSGYARKVYSVVNPTYRWRTEAHVHEASHLLVLIHGANVRLGYKDQDGRVHALKLEPAHSYFVPPNIPHQLAADGPMHLETYYRTGVLMQALASGHEARQVLRDDFFEQACVPSGESEPATESAAERS